MRGPIPVPGVTRCSFLRADFDGLLVRIEEVRGIMRALATEMGEACAQSSETFHDNFAYEDGERRQYMWGEELRRLTRVRDCALIVEPPREAGRVRLGTRVTVFDQERDTERSFIVGSYMSFADDPEVVSYGAPLARLVVGAEVGDICEGAVRGRQVELEVRAIQIPAGQCQSAAPTDVYAT